MKIKRLKVFLYFIVIHTNLYSMQRNIHINYDPNIDYNPHAITTYIKKKLLHFYKGKPNKKSLSYIILKEKNNKNIRLTT